MKIKVNPTEVPEHMGHLEYRVSHLVTELGWVDLDLGSSLAGGLIQYLPTAQAGWWNIANLSQPNPDPRPDETLCTILL